MMNEDQDARIARPASRLLRREGRNDDQREEPVAQRRNRGEPSEGLYPRTRNVKNRRPRGRADMGGTPMLLGGGRTDRPAEAGEVLRTADLRSAGLPSA